MDSKSNGQYIYIILKNKLYYLHKNIYIFRTNLIVLSCVFFFHSFFCCWLVQVNLWERRWSTTWEGIHYLWKRKSPLKQEMLHLASYHIEFIMLLSCCFSLLITCNSLCCCHVASLCWMRISSTWLTRSKRAWYSNCICQTYFSNTSTRVNNAYIFTFLCAFASKLTPEIYLGFFENEFLNCLRPKTRGQCSWILSF